MCSSADKNVNIGSGHEFFILHFFIVKWRQDEVGYFSARLGKMQQLVIFFCSSAKMELAVQLWPSKNTERVRLQLSKSLSPAVADEIRQGRQFIFSEIPASLGFPSPSVVSLCLGRFKAYWWRSRWNLLSYSQKYSQSVFSSVNIKRKRKCFSCTIWSRQRYERRLQTPFLSCCVFGGFFLSHSPKPFFPIFFALLVTVSAKTEINF